MTATDDRLEILEVLARYSFGADGSRAEDYAGTFSDDGQFVGRVGQPDEVVVAGREALTRFASGAIRRREQSGVQTRHQQSSTYFLQLDDDSALTRTYLMTTSAAADGRPRVGLTSIYEDHLRRTDEGWRIDKRKAIPDVKGVLDELRRRPPSPEENTR